MAEKQSNRDRLKEITDNIEKGFRSCSRVRNTGSISAP